MTFPLLVQFEFHPASTDGAAMAEHLRTVINDDAAVPGLRIPTSFTPDDYSFMPPDPRLSEEADRMLVVLLADDQLVAHARTGRSGGITWGDYAVQLRTLAEVGRHRFMPVQLTERLTYDRLYREALGDPELRRTKEELEAALSNTSEARKMVFELFQDLDGFSLDDYKPFANVRQGLERVLEFLRASLAADGRRVDAQNDGTYVVKDAEQKVVCRFALDRDAARARTDLDLLGLDHPLVQEAITRWQAVLPEGIGLAVSGSEGPGVLTWWLVGTRGPSGEHRATALPLGVSDDSKRNVRLERLGAGVFSRTDHVNGTTASARNTLLHEKVEPMLERELQHREIVPEGGSYAAKLIGWVEVSSP